MRFLFLIPDLDMSKSWKLCEDFILYSKFNPRFLAHFLQYRVLRTSEVFGGTLNIMRHCLVARSCGIDAVMATMSGRDTYGDRGLPGLSFVRWGDRQPDDVCIIPDFVSWLANEVEGPVVVYQQVPIHVYPNFNHRDSRVSIWTDSPLMQQICQQAYPGKKVPIVPNIVDCNLFPFVPQAEREAGLVFAFPRKGPEFIAETQARYQALGGTYWKFELIDGLSIHELAKQFRRPQVFLASAEMEGCALPPQESMASGIVVVGKAARGANFCMEHGKTSMIAETPEAAAQALIELENETLRDTISRNAYDYISQYFPANEPKQFWASVIQHYNRTRANPEPITSIPSMVF